MTLTDEYIEPVVSKFSRFQWGAAGLIMGFFLGFVDTLFIAALLGYLGLQMPAYFGVPTTFTGYFFTGMILGRLAPKEIVWEPPAGILVCVILLMLGLVGLKGHGVPLFIFHFFVVPAIAVGVCYLGQRVGRRRMEKLESLTPKKNNLAG